MVMGRPNKGVDHVDSCDGSELSKERVKVILQTIHGELSVQDACEQLGIQRARFAELRAKALQATIDAIEPGRPGRPQKRDAEQQKRERELQARIASLEHKLQVSEARVLLAHVQRAKKGGADRSSRSKREGRK